MFANEKTISVVMELSSAGLGESFWNLRGIRAALCDWLLWLMTWGMPSSFPSLPASIFYFSFMLSLNPPAV